MIIDHDESSKTGRVMTLGEREYREDIARSEALEWRPSFKRVDQPVQVDYPELERKVLEERPDEPAGQPITTSLVHPDRRLFIAKKSDSSEGETATDAAGVEQPDEDPPVVMDLHRTAQRVQWAFRQAGWNVAVWYGEHTEEFWVMDETGLHGGFKSVTDMYQGMGWPTA